MKTVIESFETIKRQVTVISQHLRFATLIKKTGRKLALSIETAIAFSLFKQKHGIETKKSVYDIFHPPCSYKTFVISCNRWLPLACYTLVFILKRNRYSAHLVKHLDATDIPVCLFKNARCHKTLQALSAYGNSGHGTFFGLRLHLVSDLNRSLLSVRFTAGNVDPRTVALAVAAGLDGLFFTDSGYVSESLRQAFYQENRRMLVAQPKKNQKKLMTKLQELLSRTRALIELNFRNLKLFYGFITSLPRSVDGYLANYVYSLLAYCIA
jgi:hypothetical protein